MHIFDYEKYKDYTWDNEILSYVSQIHEYRGKQEVLIHCPSLGSSSVEYALKKLVDDGTLKRLGAGRKTHYVNADAYED